MASAEGLDPEDVYHRVQRLVTLVPDLSTRVRSLKVADVVRLALEVEDVAARIVKLK